MSYSIPNTQYPCYAQHNPPTYHVYRICERWICLCLYSLLIKKVDASDRHTRHTRHTGNKLAANSHNLDMVDSGIESALLLFEFSHFIETNSHARASTNQTFPSISIVQYALTISNSYFHSSRFVYVKLSPFGYCEAFALQITVQID